MQFSISPYLVNRERFRVGLLLLVSLAGKAPVSRPRNSQLGLKQGKIPGRSFAPCELGLEGPSFASAKFSAWSERGKDSGSVFCSL